MLLGQPAEQLLTSGQINTLTRNFAVRPAYQNAESIANTSKSVLRLDGQNSVPSLIGIELGNLLVRVQARVLNPPTVRHTRRSEAPVRGAWNLRNDSFRLPMKVFDWAVVRVRSADNIKDSSDNGCFDQQTWNDAIAAFKKEMGNLGLVAKDPNMAIELSRFDAKSKECLAHFKSFLLEKLAKLAAESRAKSKTPIVLVVGPKSTVLYNCVKKTFDTEIGIRSVIVTGTVFAKGTAQIMANLLMKWNLQLGGVNQEVATSE